MDAEKMEMLKNEIEHSFEEAFSIVKRDDVIMLLSLLSFGMVVAIVYFPVFIISAGIANVCIEGIPFLIDCVMSNVVVILGGVVSVGLYKGIIKVLKRIKRINNKLHILNLDIENRMWMFLLVFLGYGILGMEDLKIQTITALAVSLIIGRFFWVDNDLDNI